MGALVQQSVLRQQPQQAVPLDTSNPLVPGLAHSWALNVRGPLALHDSTGKAHGVFGAGTAGSPSGNSWRAGSQYYLNFDDSGTGTVDSVRLKVGDGNGSGGPGSNSFSFAFRARIATLQSGIAIFGSAGGGIEIQISIAGKIELVKQVTAALGPSTGAIIAGVDVDIGLSYDGSTVRYYINGQPAGSSSSAQTFNMAAQHYLGAADNSDRLPNGSRIYRCDVWNRALTAAQFQAWSDNPWQMYKAPARRLWVAAGAAPSTIVATMAWTEDGDTASVGATVTDNAVTAWTEQGDGMSLAGTVAVPGAAATVAWTEAGDIAAAAGMVTDRALIAWTEQGDSASIAGDVARAPEAVSAAITWIEGGDSTAIAGRATDRASIGVFEQGDNWAILGTSEMPPGTPAPNIYAATIMRATSTNRIADIGPASINITAGFP